MRRPLLPNEEAESPLPPADIYSSDRGDGALSALLMRLYSFSRSHLQPDLWLQKQAAAFAGEDAGELEKTPWVRETLLHCQGEIAGMLGRLQEALELAGRPEGPAPYIANLQELPFSANREAARHSWAELTTHAASGFGRLNPVGKTTVYF